MPIVLNGSGTITGISAGGLPDGIIQAADLASGVGGKTLQVVQATKTDGAIEIFGADPEKKGGIYIDFSSPDQIKNAIQVICNDEKRYSLAKNAQDNIYTNFSLEILSRKLRDLFENAA